MGFGVAVALLAAAAVALFRHSAEFGRGLDSVRSASPWLIVCALMLPVANWLIMSAAFWVLMRRHGRVGLGEMTCLIGAAWLLNYVPLRPGLMGRVAYHKAVNSIAVRDSIRVTIVSIACAGVAIGVLLGMCLGAAAIGFGEWMQAAILTGVPIAIGVPVCAVMWRAGGRWWLGTTVLFRYVDLLVWTARYLVAFSLVGHPVSPIAAGAIAAIGQVAMLVPLSGNGLGLREWAVGVTSSVLPSGLVSGKGTLTTTVGLAADLVNRSVEVVCAIPIGLICAAVLARRKP